MSVGRRRRPGGDARGCRLEAVHFHSVPYLSAASQDKAQALAAVLARGQQSLHLHMVAFGDAQSEVVRQVARPLRVVLYRRLMMRIATALARRQRCQALVTGESLGQVASQTLANMTVITEAAGLPVLKPLVGMEKLEISRYAQAADTFDVSILPDQDCCTLFVPRHPATAARADEVSAAEAALDVDRLVREALQASVIADSGGRGRGTVQPDAGRHAPIQSAPPAAAGRVSEAERPRAGPGDDQR